MSNDGIVIRPGFALQMVLADLEVYLRRPRQASGLFANMTAIAVLVRLRMANLTTQLIAVYCMVAILISDLMAVFTLRERLIVAVF